MIATRIEDPALPTLLSYGHGDVVRGYDAQWQPGLSPWQVIERGERWYGRGTADNKGQHLINLTALEQTLKARDGKLGFNVKLLLEMGEEDGSPGLGAFCRAHAEELAADIFIASDGPRLAAARPTLFLGSRGVFNFELTVNLREGAHHSGNWGGLLANPGIILANAIASMVDEHGRVKVAGLMPKAIPDAVKAALADIEVGGGPGDPDIDADWGNPALSLSEKVFGWNTLDVLAFKTGNPDAPVHAIPGKAHALCHIRFVVDSDYNAFIPVRAHLDAHGFDRVEVRQTRMDVMHATRLSPTARGSAGRCIRWPPPRARNPRCCPIWAVRCPMTYSLKCWACRRSGCHTRTRRARNMPPTSTCWHRWSKKVCKSWPDCSGTWERTAHG